MDQLFALLKDTTRTGLLTKLKRKTRYPLIEFLLTSFGRPDPTNSYLFSSTDLKLVEDLEGIVRTCFLNSYEFRYGE